MAENGPREDLAKLISEKIFEKFKWRQHGPTDHDFPCEDEINHKPADKKTQHTHPVDVVFHYKDPYLNKTIYLNTDLKSYSKGALNNKMIEAGLSSLAKTIDCASFSSLWSERYITSVGQYEIRGMLFVYNHDNDFQHDFYNFFHPEKPAKGKRAAAVNLDNIDLKSGQQLHIIEPKTINYLMAVVSDMNEMIAEFRFPRNDYGFFYPQLTFHKVLTSEEYLPATIETLTSPFMIIKHGPVIDYDRSICSDVTKYPEGYVIYYNRPGTSELEFSYLLDALSSYQILNAKNNIRIRVAGQNKTEGVRSNFTRALEKYAHEWGYDEAAKEKLYSIELHIVPVQKEFYSTDERSWGLN
ncbi:hypothetical protein ACI093_001580 [Cronobacter turicensis]